MKRENAGSLKWTIIQKYRQISVWSHGSCLPDEASKDLYVTGLVHNTERKINSQEPFW